MSGGEGRNIGPLHLDLLAAAAQVGRQVARHADVRGGIDPVGGQTNLNQIVVLDVEELLGRRTHDGIGRKLHDARVRRADTQLVLGTEHAERLHAANPAALDFELLLAAVGVEHRTYGGAEHLEPRTAVGGAADNLERLAASHVDRRYVEVVRIGMVDAGQHLADHDALQTAAYGFDFLEPFDLEADVRQNHGNLLRRQRSVEVTSKPVIRNIHIVVF